jgi:DNA-binding phage protein
MATAKKEFGLIGQLKHAISASGKTMYRLAKDADVTVDSLYRFMKGQRSITLEAAEKVCEVLNLELTPRQPPKKKRSPQSFGRPGEGRVRP